MIKPAVRRVVLLGLPLLASGCARTVTDDRVANPPPANRMVYVSEALGGPGDWIAATSGGREHRGAIARPCTPMKIVTTSDLTERIVLEDDLSQRHELVGPWKADIHDEESTCLEAVKKKSEAAAKRMQEMQEAERREEERRKAAICPADSKVAFLSVRLPEITTTRAGKSGQALESCSPIRLCQSYPDRALVRDSTGAFRRLEWHWAQYMHWSETDCTSAFHDHAPADTYVVFHRDRPDLPTYRLAEEESSGSED
jgi:hypothetical protein